MLLDDLRKKLIESQKNKEEVALSTLRLLMTEIKNKEISLRTEGKEVSNEDFLRILKKQIKVRNETIPMYEKAGRVDSAEREKKEVKFIESLISEYFPDEKISE